MALPVVLLGVGLRLWQYLANPSLWVDEAAVARNVLDRGFAHLFGALDYGQVAPPGFLLGVKLSACLFGGSEYALRLVPLLAGLAGPPLFYLVARAILRPGGAIVATGFFSLAAPLIFFAADLKQYSTDVAMTLVVLGLALRLGRSELSARGVFGYSAGVALALFFSQAAVFMVTAAGAVLLVDAFVRRLPDRGPRAVLVATWAVAVLSTFAHGRSVLSPLDQAYLHRFWSPGFLPVPGALTWLGTTVQNVFGVANPTAFDGSLHYPWPALFALLVLIGGVGLCVRNAFLGALVIGPIGLALVASAAQAYPWNARLCLFLLPLFLLALVAGAEQLGDLGRWPSTRYLPFLLLPAAAWTLMSQPPSWMPEHLRPVLEHVAERHAPGDALWVYYGAGQAYEYYSKSIPWTGDVRVAICDRANPRDLLRQVDAERGRARVWILLAHGSGPFGFDERGMLLNYLGTIGRPLDAFHAPAADLTLNRAEAVLFDLSDPARLASTTAERFPIDRVPPPQTWTCYGTMSPQGSTARVERAVLGTAP
ncbi:MAG: glycosyltransferase family 39 protein [Acidobacteriota bacterium]